MCIFDHMGVILAIFFKFWFRRWKILCCPWFFTPRDFNENSSFLILVVVLLIHSCNILWNWSLFFTTSMIPSMVVFATSQEKRCKDRIALLGYFSWPPRARRWDKSVFPNFKSGTLLRSLILVVDFYSVEWDCLLSIKASKTSLLKWSVSPTSFRHPIWIRRIHMPSCGIQAFH